MIVEIAVYPLNGRCRAAISYITMSSKETSERASTGFPSACSEDMYAVPRVFPSSVTADVAV